MLAELMDEPRGQQALDREFSSSAVTLDHAGIRSLLAPYMNGETLTEVTG
jgi:hypothetical protein